MINDWPFLGDGTMKTDPSSSFICMHAVIDVGIGMYKDLVLTEFGISSKRKINQN